jgi:RNA polymerase sigma-70 factor (ECF subfamily)
MELKIEQSLIQQAQKGDQGALGQLAQAVKPRVCAYLYRVALNYDLAEDLTQETLLEMVKSIDNLREPKHFWGWLYRIGSNKFLNHCRQRKAQQTAERTIVDNLANQLRERQKEHGVSRLLQTELSKAVLSAIQRLEPQERSVLSLRCFDQLAYVEIAEALDTSEMNARVLFFRAKQALKKELVRQGLSKGSLLMALGFFGLLTEPAQAGAVAGSATMTIPAATVHVPVTTTILATCGVKGVFMAAAILLVSSIITITAAIHHVARQKDIIVLPQRQEVRSFHFTEQARSNIPGEPASLSNGAFEHWFYFPQDIEGPVFMHRQRWTTDQKDKLCSWLQNGEGNYYYHCGEKTVRLRNYRLWLRTQNGLPVRRLPSDEPQLCEFLDRLEGVTAGLNEQRDPRTQLMAGLVDNRFVNTAGFQTTYEYNRLDGTAFAPDWPDTTRQIDDRDLMHKRGWTYFQIDGVIDDEPLSGYGRIPFFYNFVKDHSAWLVLNVGKRMKIVDSNDVAVVLDADGRETIRYAGNRFFKGLLRPWMGMHTIDLLRRDAARQQIPFETIQLSDYSKTGLAEAFYADVKIICRDKMDTQAATLEYQVEMKTDLLKSVDIQIYDMHGQTHRAVLEFTYLQDISKLPPEIREPQTTPKTLPVLPDNGMRWLIDLANNTLNAQ